MNTKSTLQPVTYSNTYTQLYSLRPLLYTFSITLAVFYGLALWFYTSIDEDYAGFFTLNGKPHNGCWAISLGLAIGASSVNVFAAIVAALSYCYHHLEKWRRSKKV